MQKVLVSFPENDLRSIDEAAQRAGMTRSAFLLRAARAETSRLARPLDDPRHRRAFARLLKNAARRQPLSTARALTARDQGRR